jgi:hypothetical protein
LSWNDAATNTTYTLMCADETIAVIILANDLLLLMCVDDVISILSLRRSASIFLRRDVPLLSETWEM